MRTPPKHSHPGAVSSGYMLQLSRASSQQLKRVETWRNLPDMAASQEEEEEENNPHGENEKEVILLDIHVKNEAMENGAENETKENNKDSGESSGGRGQHFSTITDAEADLRDLMDFPNVAALYAADALSRDPRNQRRIGNKKKRNDHQENRGINSLPMPSQVLEGANNMILVSENDVSQQQIMSEGADGRDVLGANNMTLVSENVVVQQQIVGDAADGYLKSTLLLWERTKPASDGSAPKSALRADFSPSCLEGEKESADTGSSNLATIEGAIEKTTVVAEKNECVTDGAHVYLKSTSLLGERTEPTSDDSASKSASRTDFSSSYLGEKESADTGSSNLGAIEGAKEKATIVAEKNASDTAEGYLKSMSLLGERTEPATDGSAPKSALRTDLSSSRLDVEKESADSGSSNMVAIDGAKEKATAVAEKNAFASRYFDPIDFSQKICYKCGEFNHIAAECDAPKKRKKKKKKKPCFICGRLGHDGKRCKKVNKCFFCHKRGQRGHLAKDCPEKDIVSQHISNFCLRCGNAGHDLFSCKDNYFPDDLERISCLVCNAFGHLCCANISNEGPTSISCYNCGQSGHLGSECTKLHDDGKSSETTNLAPKNGNAGHLVEECMKHEEGKEAGTASIGVVLEKEDISGVKHRPKRYGRVRWRKIWKKDTANASQGWPSRRDFNNTKQQRCSFEKPGSNVSLSPMEAAKRNQNFSNFTSPSQPLEQHP